MEDIKLNRATQHESYFKRHWPEAYKNVLSQPGNSWQEKLYLYINNIAPHLCPICGKPTKFIGMWKGYNNYCCSACANKANVQKIQQSKLNKYGSVGYNNRDKAAATCMQKYGVSNPAQTEEVKKKLSRPMTEGHKLNISKSYWNKTENKRIEIKEKRINTFLYKYGVSNPMHNDNWKSKVISTYIERYGAPYGWKGLSVAQEKIKEKTKKTYPEFIDYIGTNWLCSCPHPNTCNKCVDKNYITDPEIHRGRLKYNSELCTRLLPVGHKNEGTTLELFVRNILDKHNITYENNSYNLIPPKSIDIYIPGKRIAIECNGTYWHSTTFKKPKDHYEKYKRCAAQNIQLITIWEDWIINKPDIVESLILNKIGCTQNKIYARKCNIVEVSSKQAADFLNSNHIQGKCKSKIRLGLTYNGQLVSVMCFNKRSALSGSKQIINGDWELIRYANILNTSVVGGASRLLKHFIKQYAPTQITSFSSNDISNGNLYKQLGFIKDNESVGYWYIKNTQKQERYHRSTFTKDNIIQMGLAPSLNKSEWTESDVMSSLPFYKIYDSGTTRWILKL